MGKEGKHNQPPQPVQPVNTAPTDAQAPLPPQTTEQLTGAKLLGESVRALIDGRMQTVYLTEFDGVDSYWGTAFRNNPAEGSDKMPKLTPVSGLRAYPYAERPNYAFQFVRPGEDESVLVNIAEGNLPHPED